jgi:hypothetical protein
VAEAARLVSRPADSHHLTPVDAAWLKLQLLVDGFSLGPSFAQRGTTAISYAPRRNVYNTPVWIGATVRDPPQELSLSGVVVSVNVYEGSPWQLDLLDDGLGAVIVHIPSGMRIAASLLPNLSSYFSHPELLGWSNLYGGAALAFFSPRSCYFFTDRTQCRFCSLEGTAGHDHSVRGRITPAMVETGVARVLSIDRDRIEQVMIVGGNHRNLNEGFRHHMALVQAALRGVKQAGAVDTVSLHLASMPPLDLGLIDALAEIGDLHVMFNLEVWDKATFERVCPGKHQDYGQARIVDALSHLRDVVGPYRAHSILIAGLEPPDSLLEGARALAEMGISPIINVLHSDVHSLIGMSIRPNLRHLEAIALGLGQLYDQYPIEPYWRACGRNALDAEASQGYYQQYPTAWPMFIG